MSEPFVGEIRIVGFNFAPRGWAYCNGQLLAIAENDALFSLLGTIYGGDGRTSFGLPDLRGRVPLHAGQGPGLPNYRLGESGGRPTISEVPGHAHSAVLHGVETDATARSPEGNMLAGAACGNEMYAAQADASLHKLSDNSISVNSSGNDEVSVQNPYLGCNFVIALRGEYPGRS
ncbi:phage tail protein [Granulosicoccus sp. 3-233]|uniref:phage tail protein n=1 Tax=Granulosicoccus sp. 3-233 TaxID=3417969 RepID=UPI003D32CF39